MSGPNSTTTYRDIPGFPGYRVGDDGSVWSCRLMGCRAGIGDVWRLMKPSKEKHKHGHLHVLLRRDGKYVTRGVHQLVLAAFVGPCPPGMQGCHFPDRNPENNRLDNLRWGTPHDNASDAKFHGTNLAGERSPQAKITVATVRRIRSLAGVLTQREIAAEVGLSQQTVCKIINRERWACVP
jgi:hypothetical protein